MLAQLVAGSGLLERKAAHKGKGKRDSVYGWNARVWFRGAWWAPIRAVGVRADGFDWMAWGFDYWAGQGTVLLIHGSIHPR